MHRLPRTCTQDPAPAPASSPLGMSCSQCGASPPCACPKTDPSDVTNADSSQITFSNIKRRLSAFFAPDAAGPVADPIASPAIRCAVCQAATYTSSDAHATVSPVGVSGTCTCAKNTALDPTDGEALSAPTLKESLSEKLSAWLAPAPWVTMPAAATAASATAAAVATTAAATDVGVPTEPTSLDAHDDRANEVSITRIRIDIPRTFPDLMFFHEDGGTLHDPLVEVLECWVVLRPSVGYCQGMSFLAGMLLLNMESTADAFVAFANLMHHPMIATFFRMDMPKMQGHFAVNHALQHTLPVLSAVARHLDSVGVTPDLYCLDWFMTLFTHALPLDAAARVWDVFVFEINRDDDTHGTLFLHRVALGLLKLLEPELLRGTTEDCMRLLTRLPKDLDQDLLFACMAEIDIPSRTFLQVCAAQHI
jgi:hypothetical protein